MPINIAETAQRLLDAKANRTPVDTLIRDEDAPTTAVACRVQ